MIESIDLRRLHVLRLVHRYGTVTGAAAVLRLTPSAVSHQIRQLSREVGVPLLEPNGRRVRLTPAGHTLVAHADALHAGWEQAQADLAAHATGAAGRLHMCGFPTAVAELLAPAAERLGTDCPRLTVFITELETTEGFDLVLAGEADIAVVVPNAETPPLDDAKFDQRLLLEEPLDLLVPAEHPLARRETVALADAAHDPWIIPAPGSSDFHQLTLVACTTAGFAPAIAHHAKDFFALAALVGRGLGVTLIPRLAPVPSHHAVTRVPLSGAPPPARRTLTCVRRGSHRQPAIARGLDTLRAVARHLPPPLVPPADALGEDHERQVFSHRHDRHDRPSGESHHPAQRYLT
ncbi:LysR family transcriptional regulator [Pseudonocardia acaciae]|uniref:LysR family transcriptional regulator n=1 Tax=Pseudonocardia acaciae TaxID=551276 RepID=UPI0007E8C882|nr:LysR family transcriptional regulator [Pseudonocardia acaciae]